MLSIYYYTLLYSTIQYYPSIKYSKLFLGGKILVTFFTEHLGMTGSWEVLSEKKSGRLTDIRDIAVFLSWLCLSSRILLPPCFLEMCHVSYIQGALSSH